MSLAAILACLALAAPVRAQQYSFRYYGAEEGLTNLAVKVLFQDRTGFLWAGTESGLFRFDGQRFQRYGPAEGLPHDVVLSLGEAPDGSLLAGYRGGLYQQKGHRFEKVPLPGARGVDSYSAILFDGDRPNLHRHGAWPCRSHNARRKAAVWPFACSPRPPVQAGLTRTEFSWSRGLCGSAAAPVCAG